MSGLLYLWPFKFPWHIHEANEPGVRPFIGHLMVVYFHDIFRLMNQGGLI